MAIDEKEIDIINEDIQGGYSEVHLMYWVNGCIDIELYVKDYERGVEILNIIADKLKDLDMSEDEKYSEKYHAEVEQYLEWKKEHEEEEKKKKRIVA